MTTSTTPSGIRDSVRGERTEQRKGQHGHEELRALIDEHLSALPLPIDSPELAAVIREVLRSGGKRVRPTLLLLCHELFESPPSAAAMNVALAIEVLHNFTLLHDDVLDDSPLRRNAPTVHARSSRDFAILCGDAMSVLAMHLAAACPAALVRPVLDVLCRSAYELCEGERLDLRFESAQAVSSAQYREMVSRKTGALLGAACRLGGLLAGAAPADQQHLHQFGLLLGVAFQLQDDVLDLFGSEAAVGKRIGGDVLADKKTYPILRGLELTSGYDQATLRGALASRARTPAEEERKIGLVRAVLARAGVEAAARAEVAAIHGQGLLHLEQVAVPRARLRSLRALVHVLDRRAR